MMRKNKMTVTLARWGNSLAVRIPKEALENANLHEGDRFEIVAEDGHWVLIPENPPATLAELVAAITPENRHAAVFGNLIGAERW